MRRANELTRELSALGIDETDGIAAIYADSALRQRHIQLLPEMPRRVRGRIDPQRAVAEAKLVDAQTIEEATSWLEGRERSIVLGDRALIILPAALPGSARSEPKPEEASTATA